CRLRHRYGSPHTPRSSRGRGSWRRSRPGSATWESGCQSCRVRRCGSRGSSPRTERSSCMDLLECKHPMSILSIRRAALRRPRHRRSRRTMKFARLGAPGSEIPVLVDGDRHLDLRPVTSDVDGAFLSGDFRARVTEALEAGTLPELAGAA